MKEWKNGRRSKNEKKKENERKWKKKIWMTEWRCEDDLVAQFILNSTLVTLIAMSFYGQLNMWI